MWICSFQPLYPVPDSAGIKNRFIPTRICGENELYLNLLDRQVKMPDENPSIGIILCADRNNVEVEVALQGSTAPIGVSEYSYLIPQNRLKS